MAHILQQHLWAVRDETPLMPRQPGVELWQQHEGLIVRRLGHGLDWAMWSAPPLERHHSEAVGRVPLHEPAREVALMRPCGIAEGIDREAAQGQQQVHGCKDETKRSEPTRHRR